MFLRGKSVKHMKEYEMWCSRIHPLLAGTSTRRVTWKDQGLEAPYAAVNGMEFEAKPSFRSWHEHLTASSPRSASLKYCIRVSTSSNKLRAQLSLHQLASVKQMFIDIFRKALVFILELMFYLALAKCLIVASF